PTDFFYDDVGALATAGITKGCTPSQFCPNVLVTRGQMAAFLVRALGLEDNTHPGFVDVPRDYHFYEEIGRLATAGITNGCTPSGDRFCPFGAVSRGQMAAFLDRAGLAYQP
ncbi:MAG TPA: S-layer homology domain-containing protein, partial [Acidimicrobiia bacterium]|nr:S-layer homology domain-containing protein [Acidimicrobiia bacterium]